MKKILNQLKKLDGFGAAPSLNFEGESTFKTVPGAFLTVCLYAYMLGVSLSIFVDLFKYGENKIKNYEMPVSEEAM